MRNPFDLARGFLLRDMILYGVFIGPLMEEFVFRGVILRSLKKYGAGFAILMSAIFLD